MSLDSVTDLLKDALKELDQEAEQIRKALTHLGEGSSNGTAKRDRPPKAETRPQRRARRRQAKKGQRREEVIAIIRENPDGITSAEMAKKIGISANQVSSIAKNLVAEKAAKKKGPQYTPLQKQPA